MSEDRPLVLKVEHLSKSFAGTQALIDVSLEVRRNEVHALVGTNGSGKSTLIKTLAGYHRAESGSMAWLNGEALALDSSKAAPHEQLRFVHQNLGLIDELNVMDNLAMSRSYPLKRGGSIDWDAQRLGAEALLARFGVHLSVDRPLSEATPVEKVIVAIAAALEGWEDGPCLLVLDEPTAVLPPAEVNQLFALIDEVRARGASVLYVSHRLDEIFAIADRVTVLRGGRWIATRNTLDFNAHALALLMVGKEVDVNYRTDVTESLDNDVVMEGRRVTGRYLRGVDFQVHCGEVLGIAGLPGSGREELAYAIAGASEEINGGELRAPQLEDSRWISARDARRLAIPIVPADRTSEALFVEMSLSENLTMRVLRGLGRFWLNRKKEKKLTESWVERLSIKSPGLDAPIAWLSGGNQQKVVVSRCLAGGAPLVVLCEPTAGVDIGSRIALYELIAAEVHRGLGVVVSSSDMGDLVAMCSRVIVLSEGSQVAEIDKHNLSEVTLLGAMEASAIR